MKEIRLIIKLLTNLRKEISTLGIYEDSRLKINHNLNFLHPSIWLSVCLDFTIEVYSLEENCNKPFYVELLNEVGEGNAVGLMNLEQIKKLIISKELSREVTYEKLALEIKAPRFRKEAINLIKTL